MKHRLYLKIADHYEKCLRSYGDTNLGVDWPNIEDAAVRYRIMLESIPLHQKCSLLDFGCGTAHLYEFISDRKYKNIQYSGLDISEEYIRVCKQKYPDVPFYCLDILESEENIGMFDYIIMNGVFTEKRELTFNEMFDYFREMIRVIFNKTRHGIAFNVMSKHVDWERDDLFHLPLDTLAAFLKEEISRDYVIRNDYGLYEYTAYVYKGSNKWHR